MPNSTAAVSDNRLPRAAGKCGSNRFLGDELLTQQTNFKSCEVHAE
jgi:hypothetical protein